MKRRTEHGLKRDKALSWKDYLQGNPLTHTVTQQHEQITSLITFICN